MADKDASYDRGGHFLAENISGVTVNRLLILRNYYPVSLGISFVSYISCFCSEHTSTQVMMAVRPVQAYVFIKKSVLGAAAYGRYVDPQKRGACSMLS